MEKKTTPTWTRTRVIGFRVRGDNRYTIGALKYKCNYLVYIIKKLFFGRLIMKFFKNFYNVLNRRVNYLMLIAVHDK